MQNEKTLDDQFGDYWPCACVRRDKHGNMAAIKMNHKSVKKCKKCKSERPDELFYEESDSENS